MKKLFLAAVGLTAFYGPAMAADIGRPPPRPVYVAPVPVIALFTWTGCYVGGNGGGIWAKRDWSDPVFGSGDFGSHTASGGLGGAQAGCNYQQGSWVFGIQGDYHWTSAKGSNGNAVFPLLTHESQIKSLASVTARTGPAWNRFFGYVKGGGAWLWSDDSLQVAGSSVATVNEKARGGWTIGVGGEYAWLDWLTGFVEYNYYDFRERTHTFACATCGLPVTTFPVNVQTEIHVVKAGLNLKFGPGAW